VRRLLIDGSPDQGRYPASEVNDGACPEKPVHLRGDRLGRAGEEALGEVLGGLGGYWSGFKEWHISRLSLVSEITFREERGGK
jgi:hypothetical protein